MIGNLTTYFPDLKSICYINNGEVYLDSKRVTVSNTSVSGYVRFDGVEDYTSLEPVAGVYDVSQPLIFIGSVPNGNESQVKKAVLSALIDCDIEIKNITFDKPVIAALENLDLSKFKDVVLVKVEYDYKTVDVIDGNCEFDMCSC